MAIYALQCKATHAILVGTTSPFGEDNHQKGNRMASNLATRPGWAGRINKLVEQSDRMKKRMRDWKAEAPARRGVHMALMGVGGAANGVLEAKAPTLDLGDVQIPTSLTIAGGLALLSLSGKAGDASDHLASIAGGMLACEASKLAREAVS